MSEVHCKDYTDSFLIASFETFYKQVLMCKEMIIEQTKADKGNLPASKETADNILNQLEKLIESLSQDSIHAISQFSKNFFNEALYVMVSLADEVFVNLDWPAKVHWEGNLLEQKIFGSHSAGQSFYDRLNHLLENKSQTNTELAIIYLTALGLGFRGKFRGLDDQGFIVDYKEKLYRFIYQYEPYLYKDNRPLFVEANNHTLDNSTPKVLPNARNWYFIFFGIGFSYLMVSFLIWYSNTAQISRIVDRIMSSAIISN